MSRFEKKNKFDFDSIKKKQYTKRNSTNEKRKKQTNKQTNKKPTIEILDDFLSNGDQEKQVSFFIDLLYVYIYIYLSFLRGEAAAILSAGRPFVAL